MNDEIKEILDKMQNFIQEPIEIKMYGISLLNYEVKHLLDYITNLQQENERLKEILKWKQNREAELFTIESVLETNKQLYDERNMYKSRCEKAIKYIKQEDWNTEYDYKLLSILQNGSEEK